MRLWDQIASQRPDEMIAISTEVKNRIKRYYKRDSKVIFPPVETEFFSLKREKDKEAINKDYYLLVSRLVAYKRVDLAVRAFNHLGKKLIIVGQGEEEKKLKNMARENVVFVKHLTEDKLYMYYHNAKALIFPQEEDFGITAVEAQSMGLPVIAYSKGGILDIASNGYLGVLFKKQTIKEIIKAVRVFEKQEFDKGEISSAAEKFNKKRFLKEFKDTIDNVCPI